MARTILEIYDAIIAEKETGTQLQDLTPDPETSTQLLSDLSSGSKVAIWRLWAYITAVAIYAHEVIFDIFKEEVQAIADAAAPGTPAWYRQKMLEFQYGDTLTYLNYQYVYDPVDESARIITRCAVQERSDGAVLIKVAKDSGGSPAPLSAPEKSAAESYANKVKFAGTRLAVTSLDPDVLEIDYTIYYDPLVPLATLQTNLQAAADAFLEELPFNAEFRITRFTDALQAVDGVIDPVFQSAQATPDGGSAEAITVRYVPAAGYMELDDTLANMFTFVAQIS